MITKAMLYRFKVELSDIDRGIYESLDFRIAQHPSETAPYLITRILAYSLSFQNGIEFTPGGLSDPESPALRVLGDSGAIDVWIEIGNPSARKLHKATKAARQVIVYTYKNVEVLLADMNANNVHKSGEIQIFSFEQKVLLELESVLQKNNSWSILVQDRHLSIEVGTHSVAMDIKQLQAMKNL